MLKALFFAWLAALLLTVPGAVAQAQTVRSPWPAQWIAASDAPASAAGVFHFRKSFELRARPARFLVRVSADNRYRLFVNGALVSSGPQRGDRMHWHYEIVDLAPHLRPGRNVIAALVWNWGEHRPVAQITLRTGFLLSGESEHVADTNQSWKVFWNRGYAFTPVLPPDDGGYYAASPGEVVDARQYPWGWESLSFDDSGWPDAAAIRPAASRGADPHGVTDAWQLVPRTLPAMEERRVAFARVRRSDGVVASDGFIRGGRPLVIGARQRVSVLVDHNELTMGYPVLVSNGGAGARATLTYAEALYDSQGQKGHRDEIEGRTIRGLRDQIVFDGGRQRRFQSLWLRTFRYVQLDIETADQPLEIRDLHSIFTAYPFENHAAFSSDQTWIGDVWELDWRMLRLSAFETFWDTPYYEQLQYVGDSRIEGLISVYNAGDDRLMRNAIEQFDQSRNSDGLTMSRYPSDPPQYIPPFSLLWIAMVHDYWMLRDDPEFVRQQLPGVRAVIDWYAQYVDASGLVRATPWWNFLDWSPAFERGVPPGADDGHSTAISLQFVYALQRAAEIEAAYGRQDLSAHDRQLAERIIASVRARTWDAERGLFTDAPEHAQAFSQQTNALAVLTGAAENPRAVMDRMLSDRQLVQATYYFRFYVDEAMQQAGYGDRYLGRLDPWREMIRNGLTTTPETPDPSRSDSHAWSAHPNYHLLATVLGVRPASPGFRTVRIAPALGALRQAEGRVPHPSGEIVVRLERAGADGVRGAVTLPANVSGTFLWNGRETPLRPGRNTIRVS